MSKESDLVLKHIQSGHPTALIMAGSNSDESHMKKIGDALRGYDIDYFVRIISAHKQPVALKKTLGEYNNFQLTQPLPIIAVAGGVDALSGTVSFDYLNGPVISCPPDGRENTSVLYNPTGSSNAVIYDPKNVARFVAQIFAPTNQRVRKLLGEKIVGKEAELREADERDRIRVNPFS